MAKENTKIVTPSTELKTLSRFMFPVEGVVVEAESLEEAKKILHLQMLKKDK